MLSLATAIELDDFIPGPNNPVLVYVITDEDSDDSIHEFFNPLIDSSEVIKSVSGSIPRTFSFEFEQTHEKGITVRKLGFASMDGCKYKLDYYSKLPNYKITKDCLVEEKIGNVKIENYWCSELPAAYTAGKLSIEDAAKYQNLSGCKDGETWQRSAQATSGAKSVLGEGILYATNKVTKFVPAFKNYLDNKLGSKYILAVSANIPGQSCELNGFQSYAKLFMSLQKLYTADQFSISSICSEQDISSQLDLIAKQFDTVIGREYKIDLAENETVSKLIIISKSGDKKELDKNLYSISRNAQSGSILKLDSSVQFDPSDRIELGINKKVEQVIKEVQ